MTACSSPLVNPLVNPGWKCLVAAEHFHLGEFSLFLVRSTVCSGRIKRLISERGFGFIESHEDMIFFHASHLDCVSSSDCFEQFAKLKVGQQVEYELEPQPDARLRARVVRVI